MSAGNGLRRATISPQQATLMLEMNDTNRPICDAWAAHLATEMLAGRWVFNGDSIKFRDGRLVDGQHRLLACAKAGVSIDVVIVEHVDEHAFATIDCGRRRSASDALALSGEINTNLLAGAVRAVLWIEGIAAGADRSGGRSAREWSHREVIDALNERPEIRASCAFVRGRVPRGLVPIAMLAACHYHFSRIDPALASSFVDELLTGIDLGAGDPVRLLRERLLREATAKGRLKRDYVLALIIKAWNARREGRQITNLRRRTKGPATEVFPQISGMETARL